MTVQESASRPETAAEATATPEAQTHEPRWRWHRDDLEARFGLDAGGYTRVHHLFWAGIALVATALFYWALSLVPDAPLVPTFTERGPVQYVVVFLTLWALGIVFSKALKVRYQRSTLSVTDLVPDRADFVLSPATVDAVLRRLDALCDDPDRFVLFHRVRVALSNLRNMGQIGDVEQVLNAQADADEDVFSSSHTLLNGILWAVPVLGFIGTVQGLSAAIGRFGAILAGAQELSAIQPALREVTAGLATAFDTTLVALIAAVTIHFLSVGVRKGEEELLDGCRSYCQRHIVGRLRLRPLEDTP